MKTCVKCAVAALLAFASCTTPKPLSRPYHYGANETIQLVSRGDFLELAKTPALANYVIGTINQLEYKYFQAKEDKRYCLSCQKMIRERLKKATKSPPPPLPTFPYQHQPQPQQP